MVLCWHQSNVNIKMKLQVWRVQICIVLVGAKSALTCAGRKTTPSQVSNYGAENGNLMKSGSIFRYGTVFTPKQCLYEKEATGMESPKMYSSSRCKKSHLPMPYGKLPRLMQASIWSRTEICGNPGLTFAMVACLHQSIVYIKRKLQVRRVQRCFPLVGAKTAPTCAGRQTTPSHVSQYSAENGNLRKPGSTFPDSTVFAPIQCLYEKEATGMENPQMHFSRL